MLKARLRKLPMRDIMVLLMSLMLAFGIWLLHNLSLNYSETLSVPVVAECDIEGHSNISANSSAIAARCRTSGFSILRGRHKAKKDAVHVRFNSSDMHLADGEMFYISSSELANYVSDIFGEGVQLESFLSETVQFRFPYENHKRVPVQPAAVITYKPQYMALAPIKLKPDSVTVYGEPYRLSNINRVFTKTIELSNLRSSAHGSVKIEPVQGLRISDAEVGYSLEVTRYVEIATEVSVTPRNVPSGVKLSVYPSTAKVVYKCVFPLANDPSDVVSFYIDYADFQHSIGGKCIARSSSIPDGVIQYIVEPEVFNCVEESSK